MKVIGKDKDDNLTIQFSKTECDALFYVLQAQYDESLKDYFEHSLFQDEPLKIEGMLGIKWGLYSIFCNK